MSFSTTPISFTADLPPINITTSPSLQTRKRIKEDDFIACAALSLIELSKSPLLKHPPVKRKIRPKTSVLPIPVWDFWGDIGKSPQPQPPPAPVKKRVLRNSDLDIRTSPHSPRGDKEPSLFEKNHLSLKNGVFESNGCFCNVHEIGKGSYCSVYQIDKANTKTMYNLPISEIVIKAYHRFPSTNQFMENSVQNYEKIRSLRLPVALLLNTVTARKDGVFLQQKIPYDVNVLDSNHLSQIKHFFAISVQENVAMDLQPQNLRVTKQNTVVLIDFIEEEGQEKESIPIFITKACRAWIDLCRESSMSKSKGHAVLNYITSDFLNKHPTFTSE